MNTKDNLKNAPNASVGAPKEGMKVFDTGAMRSSDADFARYDLIPAAGLELAARTLKEGAEKYGDYNWQKGIPDSDLINHCLQHIIKWNAGDRTEDHLGHAIVNLFFLAHFHIEECREIYNHKK